MLAVLPLACLVLLVVLAASPARTWREAALDGAVAFGVAATALTEALSLLHALKPWTLATCWGLFAAGLSILIWRRRTRPRPPLPRLRLWDLPLLAVPAAIGVAALASALLSAPNNWDSMTYHLARVEHWLRAGSVEHFPTTILRQLHQPPFAEFLLAHLQALSGGDRLAALVQWASLMGCLAGVSLVAKRLGASRQGQLLAAAIASTIPMAVLQASSTQNDLVLALCLVALGDAVLRLKNLDDRRAWLVAGGATGLALLTKGTGYLYALPFLLWLGVRFARGFRRSALVWAGAAAALALSLNAGHYARNLKTYGAPLGPGREGDHRYFVDQVSLGNFFAGPVRNAALHLGLASPEQNARTTAKVAAFLRALGFDANDRKTTWEGNDFRIPDLSTHEDWAGNMAHLLLYVVSLLGLVALAVVRWKKPEGGRLRLALAWAACVALGFVLFGGLLKWQLWHSRLHTPLFVLFAPIAALAVAALPLRPLPALAGLALLALANPWALTNTSRPLWARPAFTRNALVFDTPRDAQYFINRGEQTERYRKAAACLREAKCSQVGLLAGEDDWEYPLWALLGRERSVRLEHLEVHNPSERTPGADASFHPCALVSFGRAPANGFGFKRKDACSSGNLSVWLP